RGSVKTAMAATTLRASTSAPRHYIMTSSVFTGRKAAKKPSACRAVAALEGPLCPVKQQHQHRHYSNRSPVFRRLCHKKSALSELGRSLSACQGEARFSRITSTTNYHHQKPALATSVISSGGE